MVVNQNQTEYQQTVETWRDEMEVELRADDGWLTVSGLFWLHKGFNTVGSAPSCDVVLPESAPPLVGVLDFDGENTLLRVTTGDPLLVDGVPITTTTLRDDHHAEEPSLVSLGAVSFYIIKREDQYAVRVKDAGSAARRTFQGRAWFPIDERYRVQAVFHPHAAARIIELETSAGTLTTLSNTGTVEFELRGQILRLEAFEAEDNQLWLIFRDQTSGETTYKAGRFLYADINEQGMVDLDFNRAYHPPCAFTPYATCPLAPRQNVLPISITAGERYAGSKH